VSKTDFKQIYNPKKINDKGDFERYYGYTIIAKIDPKLMKAAERIEHFLETSVFKKRYSAVPAHSYHMSIYTIFSCSNKHISPVKKWVKKTGQKISKDTWLPESVLEEENNMALCTLEKFLHEPLHIKYATLTFSDAIIRLQLELDETSLKSIRKARKKLSKIYDHRNKSLEPIEKKLHITLAYAFGRQGNVDVDAWNELNELVKPFTAAKSSLASLYQYDSMVDYYNVSKKSYVDCRAYE